ACLNSRPITKRRSALTLGHFLIGRPLITVPEKSVLEINTNQLSRWQLVQAMQIWGSWSKDYLHLLQVRNKWSTSHRILK
ncbi:hypothetical protein HN011_003598, partial [Eciton burchellii]